MSAEPQPPTDAILPRPPLLTRLPSTGPAVIEASAGTGKTYTIERLVLDLLIRDVCEIGEILVVTFTVRATHDLKLRIRSAIETVLRESIAPSPSTSPGHDDEAQLWRLDDPARQRLSRALAHFDTASIQTIHGFCQKVLRDHAFACGRPFDQVVVDSRAAFARAFRDALRHDLARDPRMSSLLTLWLSTSSVAELEDTLRNQHRQTGRLVPELDQARLDALIDAATRLRAMLRSAPMRHHVLEVYNGLPWRFRGDIPKARLVLDSLFTALTRFYEGAWADLVSELGDLELDILLAPRLVDRRQEDGAGSLSDAMDEDGEAFVGALSDLDRALVPLDAAAVQWFLPAVETRLRDLKASEGWLDHDDMLHELRDALDGEGGETLCAALRSRFAVAMIDEFQDTDPVQWEIFERVFVPDDEPRRLFLIGDPKQAIYGFRGGDIFTYIAARDRVTTLTGTTPAQLTDNYRSTASMVALQNLLFDQAADEPFFTGEIEYQSAVRCARERLRLVDAGGGSAASLVLLDLAATDQTSLNASLARERHGRAIAASIRELLGDAPLFLEDADDAGEVARRRLGARDVYLLVRTNREAVELSRYLRDAGVPFAFFKRDGLFQSEEAREIRDVLAAVAHPQRRSSRLRAWTTPFFGVPLSALHRCLDLPDTHPLLAKLYRWHGLAREQRYEALFAAIVAESGAVRRELFSAAGERRLTNIAHIFETLLDEVSRSRGTLDDLLARLDGFIAQREQPGVDGDGNVQRLESDRDAVQILTIHKAKGLEAPIVYLFGGLTGSDRAPYVYHLKDEASGHTQRWVSLEQPDEGPALEAYRAERAEEDQRLLYVAITRAAARVVAPVYTMDDVAEASRPWFVDGSYEVLRRRLQTVAERGGMCSVETTSGRVTSHMEAVLERVSAKALVERTSRSVPDDDRTLHWQPPAELLATPSPSGPTPGLRNRRFVVTSYSRMKADDQPEVRVEPELGDLARATLPPDALPGGPRSGGLVHEILEEVVPSGVLEHPDPASWGRDPNVAAVVDDAFRRHGISPSYAPSATSMAWHALRAPVPLPDGTVLDGLANGTGHAPEIEFEFPLPETWHPRLNDLGETEESPQTAGKRVEVERGWVKGYIDLVVIAGGRVFFADWKTDVLPDYRPAALQAHVDDHYAWQIRLYTLALAKLLRAHDQASWDARFGGYIYAFVRGMDAGADPGLGLWVARPTWTETLAFEDALIAAPIGLRGRNR